MMNQGLFLDLLSHSPDKGTVVNLCQAYPEYTPDAISSHWRRMIVQRFGSSFDPSYQTKYQELFQRKADCKALISRMVYGKGYKFTSLNSESLRILSEIRSSNSESLRIRDPNDYITIWRDLSGMILQIDKDTPFAVPFYKAVRLMMHLPIEEYFKTSEIVSSPSLHLTEEEWRDLILIQFPDFPPITYQEAYLRLLPSD